MDNSRMGGTIASEFTRQLQSWLYSAKKFGGLGRRQKIGIFRSSRHGRPRARQDCASLWAGGPMALMLVGKTEPGRRWRWRSGSTGSMVAWGGWEMWTGLKLYVYASHCQSVRTDALISNSLYECVTLPEYSSLTVSTMISKTHIYTRSAQHQNIKFQKYVFAFK